ncbi:kinase-like protein, partial [Fistulina hepatica ATCC 64428]
IFFAQDEKGRHVAIKLVKKDSDEYKIAQILLEKGDAAGNHCVIPVLDIIDCEEHAFMVMPRWDEMGLTQWLRTLANVLDYVHCLLKVLLEIHFPFLHEHCIIHRDLKDSNILCNHFGTSAFTYNFLRWELMVQRKLTFAIADFNLSLFLPSSCRPRSCRLPARRSWESIAPVAHDLLQGEIDYDPFLLDVGSLGMLFAEDFRRYIPLAPMLAPLIDSMVTDDLSRRFTASEALQFFESTVNSVPPENLDMRLWLPQEELVYLDRWVDLPTDFVSKWSAYRVQKPSLWTRAPRWFCGWGGYRPLMVMQTIRFLTRGHLKAAFYRAMLACTLNLDWLYF